MRTLLSEAQLREGVARLADQVAREYEGRDLTIVGVLTGSVVLLADLIRQLDLPLRVGVMQASSYRGSTMTPGKLFINADLMPDIEGRDVLLVDDIFDTGHTLVEVMQRVRELNPKSLRSLVLLRKAERQEVVMAPDYVGFEIPNEFVVGYGLDYHDAYRNLPYVAALGPEDLVHPD
jgi:hypoxanthine phosphoribosyltransferase